MKSIINWFNLASSDIDRAISFYSGVLAIEMQRFTSPDGFENAFFPTLAGEGFSGAISANPQFKAGAQGATIYFDVDGRMEEVLARVGPGGGQVVMPRTNIGEFGFIAMALDTEGNMIGFHSTS